MILNPIPKQSLNWASLRLKHKGLNLPKEKQFGFIAQEVEQVFPNLVTNVVKPVHYDKKGEVISPEFEFKALNYQNMIAISIGAIQQLNSKIDSLSNLVNQLRIQSSSSDIQLEQKSFLGDNVPNPFTTETVIDYRIGKEYNECFIAVYNLIGEELRKFQVRAKEGSIELNSDDLKNGSYTYSLVIDGKEVRSNKMILSR